MYHMPSRIPAIHTCTCAQSLHSDDVGACAAERQGWGRRSRPEIAGEAVIPLNKYCKWRSRNAHYIPVHAVLHLKVFPEQTRRFRASCMGHQAFHEDGQHIVEASVDILEEAGDLDSETYREARTASTEDRWDLMQQCLDLQAHPR